jgi:hypothetical protein
LASSFRVCDLSATLIDLALTRRKDFRRFIFLALLDQTSNARRIRSANDCA